MRPGPSFFVAWRSLTGRRHGMGSLGGAVAGIALSLVPLVLALTVSDGMIRGITDRYLAASTYHVQAEMLPGMDEASLEAARQALRAVPGLVSVRAELQGSGVLAATGATGAVSLRAVEPEFFSDAGSILEFSEGATVPVKNNEILLGTSLAHTLGVRRGSLVTLMTQGERRDSPPRITVYRVTGTLSAGYRELDALWAFVTPESARRALSADASRLFLGLKVEDPYGTGAATAAGSAREVLRNLHPDWYDEHYVRSWQEAEGSLFRSFATTKAILGLVMAIAVLVAATNLGAALGVFVAERRADIAILKSFGTDSRMIRAIFTTTGAITGLAGTSAGLGAGILLSWRVNDIIHGTESILNLAIGLAARAIGRDGVPMRLLDPGYYLERIPVLLDPAQILAIALASIVVCVAASLVPANRAAAVLPMELLRKT